MISPRPSPFDVIARVLARRLRGCEPSEELRAIVHNRGVDWEHVVGDASGDLVPAATGLGLSESLETRRGLSELRSRPACFRRG